MEATGVFWTPVWNILSGGDFELIVANTKHVKNVPGRKTDMNDAKPRQIARAFVDHQHRAARVLFPAWVRFAVAAHVIRSSASDPGFASYWRR